MLTKFRRTVISAGSALIGKVRLVDSGGSEVTDGGDHAVRTRLIDGENIIGKVQLVNDAGEGLTTGQALNALIPSLVASTMGDDRVTITTAGARQPLRTTPTPCKWVIVTAETDNGSKFVVGGPTVIAALATRQGTPLDPGDSVILAIDDVSKVFGDVEVAGEGVTLMWGL